jgi:hypothetical protein
LQAAEAKLARDIVEFQQQKEALDATREQNKLELQKERSKLDKDRATLAQLDKYLAAKDRKLAEQEKQRVHSTESSKDKSLDDKAAAALVVQQRRQDELVRKEQSLLKLQESLCEKQEQLAFQQSQLEQSRQELQVRSKSLVVEQESTLQETQSRLATELAESHFFARVRSMAERLQQREEELARERQALYQKMQECEECKRHLQKWQEDSSTAARRKEQGNR